MNRFLLSAAALACMTGSALAGPAEDLAKARIEAIAKGDIAAVTAAYSEKATLHWVGGMLDGAYTGQDKLKEVWEKFSKALGETKATVVKMDEAANPKGATVSSDVIFAGKNTAKVRYIMVYRDGKLADEIWQVNPNANY